MPPASALLISLLAAMVSAVHAQQPAAPLDPHTVYEQRCLRCHNEHGADLARQKLRLAGARVLVAHSGHDVEAMLKRHHGVTLAAGEWPALASLFRLGLTTGGAYQLRCARCHDRAVTLAREKLVLTDGRLLLRSSRRDVAAFLTTHGEAKPAEIDMLIKALTFHLETPPKPAAN